MSVEVGSDITDIMVGRDMGSWVWVKAANHRIKGSVGYEKKEKSST